jgi:hypothetical protein
MPMWGCGGGESNDRSIKIRNSRISKREVGKCSTWSIRAPGPSGWTYKIKFFSRGWEFGYNVVELHVPIQKEKIMEGEDSLLFVDQLLSNANPSKIQLY